MSTSTPTATHARTDYLALCEAATDAEKFPLVRRWIDNEPLPFFAQLRDQRPVLATPVATIVARLADVTEVLSQPKIFTVELY